MFWKKMLLGTIIIQVFLLKSSVQADQWSSSNPTVFNIGGVLSNNESAHYFKETILACVIGVRTKKNIFLGVRNKYCTVCAKAAYDKETRTNHVCYKNWTTTSTAMESDIILEAFRSSIAMHGLIYGRLIGDGDSNVYSKLISASPYGPSFHIEKVECKNHLLRNYVSKLSDLKSNTAYKIEGRKILEPKIEKLRLAVTGAINYWREREETFKERTVYLKDDILNGPLHVFGNHDKCRNYFCDEEKRNAKIASGEHLNFDQQYVPKGVTYYDKAILMDPNPIRTALNVCKHLISRRVYAVVVSHPLTGDLSPAAVSYTCGFYHIPVIGISSRDSAFSDKNIHVSFLRTVPPYSHQADVWVELLKHFNYKKVIFIHSSDTDGRALLGRFQTTSQSLEDDIEIKVQVESVIEFEPGLDNFIDQLQEMKSAQSRVYLLYASKVDAKVIFRDASLYNMTEAGYAWIVTEQALKADNVPEGILGLKLVNATNEKAHIRDSIYVLASALRDMNQTKEITEAPKDCDNSGSIWETGRELFNFIRKQVLLNGETGKVAFDDQGDRINAEYNIVNIQRRKTQVVVGKYHFNRESIKMQLSVEEKRILWPGRQPVKPEGFMIPTHLKVLTIEEKPFVYTRKLNEDQEACLPEEIICPHFNSTQDEIALYCCKGYCMDLLKELSKKINFTYSLALSPDGQFGNYLIKNSSVGGKKEWTGLIGELVSERADMIVAPLTINPERAEFIEFSKPFKYQGITILEKKPSRSSTLVSFLQPFSNTLWILVMVSVHVVALVLYLLDRFSPFGRFKLANTDGTEEDALNLSSAIWFAWGVLLNSGIGEGTPRSFSARVLGMVWAGFAMIIVASYTANLAAFLVLERPKTKLTGINDARLRNTMENLTCATVKGSAVDMYFRRQVELSNMYRTMEANNYNTAEDAISDVKIGKLMAFIWDSSRLEFEAAQDCELVTAGELFGRSGYGIGLQKGSPWADDVTLAVLDFHESGFMEALDNKWILQGNIQQCEQFEKTPNTLGLKNMAGVFILVAAGIVGGVGLIVIEMAYKKHQIKKQKRMELARHAADKWRGCVEKRKSLRSTTTAQRRIKSNGVNDTATISLAVDKFQRTAVPERAWPGDSDIRQRKLEESGGVQPVPRYLPAYTTDVSHLIV